MRKKLLFNVFLGAIILTCMMYRTVAKAYFQNGWRSGSVLDYACAISLLLLPLSFFLLFVLWEEADEQWTSFRKERDERMERDRINREKTEAKRVFAEQGVRQIEQKVFALIDGAEPPPDPSKIVH